MYRRPKALLFKHYPLIALIALIVGVTLVMRLVPETDRLSAAAGVGAAVAGFAYFVQQQRLAETALFHQLFREFNERYDKLNEPLRRAVHGEASDTETREVVADYMNLCAEEYLYYLKGYIFEDVWSAWCRGMQEYARDQKMRSIMDVELESNTHYGFSLATIGSGE